MKELSAARRLALSAVLTALALGLSYAERAIPLGLVIPLPGIKLGLANVVTLFALCALGPLPTGNPATKLLLLTMPMRISSSTAPSSCSRRM